ncbi:hypothetical protein Tcan_00254 [Toxocara canis]|uniref:Uncharacterized protein n=1 Tax=Toxocara canis TaxID=6265 RepID=A0A0B2VQ78_TOXCA|nr:hypothetical protein Tcan_00254 [Toxocara canis]
MFVDEYARKFSLLLAHSERTVSGRARRASSHTVVCSRGQNLTHSFSRSTVYLDLPGCVKLLFDRANTNGPLHRDTANSLAIDDHVVRLEYGLTQKSNCKLASRIFLLW